MQRGQRPAQAGAAARQCHAASGAARARGTCQAIWYQRPAPVRLAMGRATLASPGLAAPVRPAGQSWPLRPVSGRSGLRMRRAGPAGFRPRTGGSTGGAGSVLGLAGRPKTRRPTARGSASRPRPRKPGNFFGRASRAERHGNPFIFRCVLSMVWGSVIVGLVREIMD